MITIERTYHKNCTTGLAKAQSIHGTVTFHTLELPWKNNERQVSCIPEGTYKVNPHTSPKFGKCFWLQDVPNRSEILIHTGNFTREILGCILPGTAHRDIDGDGITDVVSSRVAMNNLLGLLFKHLFFDIIITSKTGPPK